jgi:hypothetical protein
LVQGRPLTIELIRRFFRLPAEFRAVVGLCSQPEWDDLRTKHLLPQVFDRRGGALTTISPNGHAC